MLFVPRDYQVLLEGDVRAAFEFYLRVLAVSPTGSGKTQIFCSIVAKARSKGRRVIILAHRIEIVEQIGKALFRFGVPHGWIAPGHAFQKQPVMVAMVQSLARRLDQIETPDLIIVDEAHHATAGQYRKVMDAWPKVYVLGVTASPARTDGQGLGDVFQHMVFGPSMKELIARGYLAPFRCFAPPPVADLSGLAVRGGDFASDQVALVMDHRAVTGDAVRHYAKLLNGAPAIAFCSSVEHAEHVAKQFTDGGWKATSVDGSMPLGERARRIQAIGNGDLNVLTSCDVISEGTDIPSVAGAILLRPTQSLIVYLQQVGRVLRPKPDGSAAIILDHVNNVVRMGMPDADREWSLAGRARRPVAPAVRQCPMCWAAFAPAPRCPACQFVFPVESRVTTRKVVDGDLREISAGDVEARLMYLRNEPLKDLLKKTHTREGIEEIRRARGYEPGWVMRMLAFKSAARERYRGGRAA